MSNQSDLAKSAAGFNGDPLSIDTANNRVGIGTSSPLAKLQVKTQTNGNAAFQNSTSVTGGVKINAFNDAGNASVPFEIDGSSLQFNIAAVEKMRIDSSGNLLVGTTGSLVAGARVRASSIAATFEGEVTQASGLGAVFWANRTSSDGWVAAWYRGGSSVGSISVTSSSTSYNTSSDHRLKENVTDVTDGITRVKQLEPKRFNFIADPDKTVDGFLAHEAQTVVPEAITGTHNQVDDDGNPVYQGIDQAKLVPLLTAALKESIAKIEALEARVTALEGN
jgi:hypothetical protein